MLLSLKRAFRVILAIAATLLFYVALFRMFILLDSFISSPVVVAFELSCFFVGLLLPLPVWVYLRHKRRSAWIREEAQRWLTERRANSERPRYIKRRRKLLRKMLWIPSVLALSISLFLPQSMGLVSHLFYRAPVLKGHRVRLPVTAFIYGNSDYMDALIGQGIARVGFKPYWRLEPPFSSLSFSAIQEQAERFSVTFLQNETATIDRTLSFGDETISCWRISRLGETMPPGFIDLRCRTSKNDFLSGFYGSREDANVFYKALERAAQFNSS